MSLLPLESFVTRRVVFAHAGQSVRLCLSQSLFSSQEVDRGSALLLRSVAGEIASSLPRGPRVLDVGCGTGVLGLWLARALPGARLCYQDRDALAVAFTAMNCRENALEPAGLQGELAFQGAEGIPFDLVVSNVPAKAGEPVHADMLARLAGCMSPSGVACLVIVAPLHERIRRQLEPAGLEARELAAGPGHTIFHARRLPDRDPPGLAADPLAAYARRTGTFDHHGVSYALAAVHGLPEFDTPAHATRLALEMASWLTERERSEGPTLIWNPGQGHLPAYLASRRRPGGSEGLLGELTLAGRDLLALRAAARNAAGARTRIVHSWDPAAVAGRYACMYLFPDDEPHVLWDEALCRFSLERLIQGGVAVVSSSATFVARLLGHAQGLTLLRSKKRAGARSVVLRKP